MANEASKTNALRSEIFFKRYLSGRVIDIGSRDDLVVPQAEPFDLEQGDAERILDFRRAETYDCVHSSHCLEHMSDPPGALADWWQLVKPGGHLVVVVPEEHRYEQGHWPSALNTDHKASFRMPDAEAELPNSYCLKSLLLNLPDGELVSFDLHDQFYDMKLRGKYLDRLDYKFYKWANRGKSVLHRTSGRGWMAMRGEKMYRNEGYLLDQTIGPALAQIQAVMHKISI